MTAIQWDFGTLQAVALARVLLFDQNGRAALGRRRPRRKKASWSADAVGGGIVPSTGLPRRGPKLEVSIGRLLDTDYLFAAEFSVVLKQPKNFTLAAGPRSRQQFRTERRMPSRTRRASA